MKFLRDILRAWQYRQKKSVTPEQFLDAMQRDFGRSLDSESVLFFAHHATSVNLINKIFSGRLKSSGDPEKNSLVLKALIADVTEYTPTAAQLSPDSATPLADIIEEFSKTYKDAGNIMGQAIAVFQGWRT